MPDVYRILKSTMEDIADAIRTKTGGSASLTPAQMVTEIGSIETGGSLPSVIGAIDGGSFTLANDTATGNMPISHNLGVTPSGIAIWSEDIVVEAYSIRTLEKLLAINGGYVETQINANGVVGVGSGTVGTIGTEYFTISIPGGVHYKAGATYKWLAWA